MITLVDILQGSAKLYPDQIAVKVHDQTITYAELYQKATCLACQLAKQGATKGDRVAFLFNKSLEAVLSLYGILLAGAAYVPLDIKSPRQRLATIISDCSCQILICSDKYFSILKPVLHSTSIRCIVGISPDNTLECNQITWHQALAQSNDSAELPSVKSSDLSYILYTSGSTGIPKGIAHTHYSALSFVKWAANQFQIDKDDIVSSHAPFQFDLSVLDLFASCLAGATMILIPEYLTKFPVSIVQLIQAERISVWYSVPSALIQMLTQGNANTENMKSLQTILFAGEVFPPKHLKALVNLLPKCHFANLYGPTETNVCTYYELENSDFGESVPIGRACLGFDWVLEQADGSISKEFREGELLVRGPHLMQGYWGQPALTTAAFKSFNNCLYYKTGDWVRQNDKGELIYVDRINRQVKVRGFRIELNEIEYHLQNMSGIENGIAFVVGEGDTAVINVAVKLAPSNFKISKSRIINSLRKVLPKYAVPNRVIILDRLPKTTTGKIDRKRVEQLALD